VNSVPAPGVVITSTRPPCARTSPATTVLAAVVGEVLDLMRPRAADAQVTLRAVLHEATVSGDQSDCAPTCHPCPRSVAPERSRSTARPDPGPAQRPRRPAQWRCRGEQCRPCRRHEFLLFAMSTGGTRQICAVSMHRMETVWRFAPDRAVSQGGGLQGSADDLRDVSRYRTRRT
jgi:hypothetical protein